VAAAALRRLQLKFPAELIAGKNEVEMQVTLKNRSVFQILGADQADRLRGTNPVGVAFDEYALMPGSEAWDLTRPILAENGGFAVFAFTPQGRNHAHQLYEQARQSPEWFTTRKTVDDTRRDAPGENGRPIIAAAQIAQDLREGMPKELADQEYYEEPRRPVRLTYLRDGKTKTATVTLGTRPS